MKNILFFGDSLTAGYGLSNAENQSFPGLIRHKINQLRLPYLVINAGVSGDTSGAGLNRLNYWLSRPIDVFVLELGINDIMQGNSPDQISASLQTIIDRVKARYPEVKIVLMGMEVPVFIPSPFISEFTSLYCRLAVTNKIALLPFLLAGVAGRADLNLSDRIHPSAEGYQIIAENVWKVIGPLLSSESVV